MQNIFPPECDLLITAAYIVTQDDERQILENGAIAVSGDHICAVGTHSAAKDCKAVRTLDLGNALLMPGLVNAHTHVSMTFFRGLADDLPLHDWLTGHIFPREAHLTPEIVELGAMLACAEMIRTGTTAFSDMYILEDSVARAVDKAGVRCLMGEGIFAFASKAYSCAAEAYQLVREQAQRYREHPRIRVAVAPHAVYTTTPEILAGCRDLAQELNLPLHIHLSETRTEVENCLQQHGKRPVQYCHDLGVLTPKTTIAHGVVLDDAELGILAATKTRVAHNPKSNMKLASGVAPVPAMLARGITVGLGTDGAASNNALNMFQEMAACALMQKVHTLDATVCPAQAVLDMATRGGALALDWEGLGTLTKGAAADMIALDLDSPNLLPLYHADSHLVYAASGHEVCLTMVGGRILYHDGVYTTIDYPALIQETAKLTQWVRSTV